MWGAGWGQIRQKGEMDDKATKGKMYIYVKEKKQIKVRRGRMTSFLSNKKEKFSNCFYISFNILSTSVITFILVLISCQPHKVTSG